MMKLSVAPVPYFWSKDAYLEFYKAVERTKVDIVYLGETVCSKRRTMTMQDWLDIANSLTAAGKEVVLSTLTLLEAESELNYLKNIARQKEYLVEANDMAAVQVAFENENRFVAGCAINLYNNQSLTRFGQLGMSRWVVPVELGKEDLNPMIQKAQALGIEVEYQVFGRMPLAYSARCFTARHHHLPKDNCQFKCLEDEQGLKIKTQEGDSFAQINGIQTQSAKVSNLLNYLADLEENGIDIARIVPVTAEDTLQVIDLVTSGAAMTADLSQFNFGYEYCNGYWLQAEGMSYVPEMTS